MQKTITTYINKHKLFKSSRLGKIVFFAIPSLVIFYFIIPTPSFSTVSYATILEAKDGSLLGARLARDGQWRFPPSRSLYEKFTQSILHFEDEYFYSHPGINPVSLWKSLVENIKQKRVKRGGSTISMQVVRLSRENQRRTIAEKVIEILMALKMEFSLSKDEILALYVAHAPFGGNVVGLSAAAWRYYGRPPELLSWAECATLAVLPNSPSLIYPGKNGTILKAKRDKLLDKLLKNKVIDASTCSLSKAETLPGLPQKLPALANHLLNKAIEDGHEGKIVKSTLNAALQGKINEKVQLYHQAMRENYVHNAAVLVVDIETGNVVSYVGNVKTEGSHGQYVDIISSNRSTGSLLKPILYAAAIDEGILLPQQLLSDVPFFLQGFAPQNFDNKFHGAVPADIALARSYNVPFVHLLKAYGYEKFHQKLKNIGVYSLKKPAGYYGLSMILGGAESSLWEVTAVYASMARSLINYFKRPPGKQYSDADYHSNYYVSQTDIDEPIYYKKGFIGAGSISHMFQAMQALNRPEEQAGWEQYTSSNKISWKTGTSYGFKDAWALGLNTKFVVGVWLGNADGEGRPELVGIKAAAPLLFNVFELLGTASPLPIPIDGQKSISVCTVSGFKAGRFCDVVNDVLLPSKSLSSTTCPHHQQLHLDEGGTYQVNSSCYPVSKMVEKNWFVLPPAEAWYYKQYHPQYAEPPELHLACTENQMENNLMEFIYPRNSTRIYVPTELDGSPGSAVFEVAHRNPAANIFWHLDDEFLGVTKQKHQLGLSPTKGNHRLYLVDDQGRELTLSFEVISEIK